MRKFSGVLVAALLAGVPAHAQRSDSAKARGFRVAAGSAAAKRREEEQMRRRLDFIPAKTFTDAVDLLTARNATGRTLMTAADEQTTYLMVRRTTTSDVEVHARWDDIVLVRSGTGAIALGDSLFGSEYRGPGERRGGRLVNSSQLVVHAGDVVRIPAAVPHAFVVTGTVPLEYVVIKIRRQNLPIRWFTRR
jgi:mannose-6-phosphate isomerase-like protein (cupin superfamily)